MPPTYIRPVLSFPVPAFKPLDALDGKVELVLFLLYRIFRPQRYAQKTDGSQYSDSHGNKGFIAILTAV